MTDLDNYYKIKYLKYKKKYLDIKNIKTVILKVGI